MIAPPFVFPILSKSEPHGNPIFLIYAKWIIRVLILKNGSRLYICGKVQSWSGLVHQADDKGRTAKPAVDKVMSVGVRIPQFTRFAL